MSLGVFLAVIGAAFLHALWNALIKLGTSKLTGMLILTLIQGAIGLIIATRREHSLPGRSGSGCSPQGCFIPPTNFSWPTPMIVVT